MRLENLFFTSLSNGTLAADAFRVGTTAVDGSDRIIYNDYTGALFFDRDGTGAAAKVQFAEVDAGAGDEQCRVLRDLKLGLGQAWSAPARAPIRRQFKP